MENNGKKSKESNSMYLYTALIFVVALLLILLAFFGQTNISKLGNRANEITQGTAVTTTAAPLSSEEYARISNMASSLDTENKELKNKLTIYDNLINANFFATDGNPSEAQTIIDTIDKTTLNENQKVLYEQIKDKIAEGEE